MIDTLSPPPPTAPDDRAARRSRSRRQSVTFVALVALVCLVGVLALSALGADVVVRQRYESRIERFEDPTALVPEESRPPAGPDGAVNVLLLGSDSRISAGDASQWEVGAQRTDAIMLVHVPADRSGLYVVSIPRDTWVDVPGHGQAKVNAAFSYGGPALMVQTVEQLTGLRLDHVAVVDFEGFSAMTDALDGVRVTVPEQTQDMRATFPAGTDTMDGPTALNYVRQRDGLDDGDFDRVRRQQNWIRSVFREALSRDTLTSPTTLDAFLRATTASVALDESFTYDDMRGLAFGLRDLRGDDLHLLTVPTAGTGRSADGQSVVLLDEAGAAGLFQAVTEERAAQWLTANPDALLGERVD